MPKDEGDGFGDVALLIRAFQLSKMLHVAATLEIADRVQGGAKPASALASECGADPSMLLRMCRALAAFGIFTVDGQGNVGQSARSEWLRKDAKPTLHHAARYWTTPGNWGAWANLEHAIRKGKSPFGATWGMPNFEYLKAHPEEAALFDLFMQHSPDDRHAAVAEAYDFSDVRVVVDVGGGNGALLKAILSKHPGVQGILYDQEDVVAAAPSILAGEGISDRITVKAGNFFDSIPPGGDCYAMSQILHDWNDERCLAILRNCRAVMSGDARVLVIERVLDNEPGQANPTSFLADMQMMVIHDGAKERTASEYGALFEQTGFGKPRVIATRSVFSIIETRPV